MQLKMRVAVFTLIAIFALVSVEAEESGRVVCYYAGWAAQRRPPYEVFPRDLNPSLCTHLIYASAVPSLETGIAPAEPANLSIRGYKEAVSLKVIEPTLKVLLSLEAIESGSATMSRLMADEEVRCALVKGIVSLLRSMGMDGLDIDWQFPGLTSSQDSQHLTHFIRDMRYEMEREARDSGREPLLLTMAVPPLAGLIELGFQLPELNKYVSFFNVLSMDYHTSSERATAHPSPLYSLPGDQQNAHLNIDSTVKYYLSVGVNRDKIVVGVPLYGRTFLLQSSFQTGLGAAARVNSPRRKHIKETLALYELCRFVEKGGGWTTENPNATAMGPYSYYADVWVAYDDIDIVVKKAEYVKKFKLGGLAFWTVDQDDVLGECGERYGTVAAARRALSDQKIIDSQFPSGSDNIIESSTPAWHGESPSEEQKLPGSISTAEPWGKVDVAVSIQEKLSTVTENSQSTVSINKYTDSDIVNAVSTEKPSRSTEFYITSPQPEVPSHTTLPYSEEGFTQSSERTVRPALTDPEAYSQELSAPKPSFGPSTNLLPPFTEAYVSASIDQDNNLDTSKKNISEEQLYEEIPHQPTLTVQQIYNGYAQHAPSIPFIFEEAEETPKQSDRPPYIEEYSQYGISEGNVPYNPESLWGPRQNISETGTTVSSMSEQSTNSGIEYQFEVINESGIDTSALGNRPYNPDSLWGPRQNISEPTSTIRSTSAGSENYLYGNQNQLISQSEETIQGNRPYHPDHLWGPRENISEVSTDRPTVEEYAKPTSGDKFEEIKETDIDKPVEGNRPYHPDHLWGPRENISEKNPILVETTSSVESNYPSKPGLLPLSQEKDSVNSDVQEDSTRKSNTDVDFDVNYPEGLFEEYNYGNLNPLNEHSGPGELAPEQNQNTYQETGVGNSLGSGTGYGSSGFGSEGNVGNDDGYVIEEQNADKNTGLKRIRPVGVRNRGNQLFSGTRKPTREKESTRPNPGSDILGILTGNAILGDQISLSSDNSNPGDGTEESDIFVTSSSSQPQSLDDNQEGDESKPNSEQPTTIQQETSNNEFKESPAWVTALNRALSQIPITINGTLKAPGDIHSDITIYNLIKPYLNSLPNPPAQRVPYAQSTNQINSRSVPYNGEHVQSTGISNTDGYVPQPSGTPLPNEEDDSLSFPGYLILNSTRDVFLQNVHIYITNNHYYNKTKPTDIKDSR